MNNFKFFRGEENRLIFHQPAFLNINNVEFCFQFDDEEPVVFGQGPNDLHIHVSPTLNGNITFSDNDKRFKIFAREIDGGNRA
jgi:hypothetical protein